MLGELFMTFQRIILLLSSGSSSTRKVTGVALLDARDEALWLVKVSGTTYPSTVSHHRRFYHNPLKAVMNFIMYKGSVCTLQRTNVRALQRPGS